MRTCFCGHKVWGTDKNTGIGYCQSHQWKRTDKKKKTPMVMEKEDKKPIEHSFGYINQSDMFFDLWEKAQVPGKGIICPFTHHRLNCYFGSSYFFSCFAHILPKGRYTYWKYNPDNIAIVHPDFHAVVDGGSTDDRKKHPEWDFDAWDALVEKKKAEYVQFKKDNLLA